MKYLNQNTAKFIATEGNKLVYSTIMRVMSSILIRSTVLTVLFLGHLTE